MPIHIEGGTPNHSNHLCLRCTYGMRRTEGPNETTYCSEFNKFIRDRVSACTEFSSRQEHLGTIKYRSMAMYLDLDLTGDLQVKNAEGRLIPRWDWHPKARKPRAKPKKRKS